MNDLSGLRALVVEDEGSVALLIEEMLLDLGCEIAASVARLTDACRIAGTATFDFAVLDVNLGGKSVLPVAQILRDRRIPFVFSTGYGADGLPEEFGGRPVLSKPFALEEFRRVICAALHR